MSFVFLGIWVMERRFEVALEKALSDCVVSAKMSVDQPKRFRELATPFGDVLAGDSERYYFHATLEGLAATGRKNLESIAYMHDSDPQMYQVFGGQKNMGPQAAARPAWKFANM